MTHLHPDLLPHITGLAHAQHMPIDDPVRTWSSLPPETLDALNEVAAFFEHNLGGGGGGRREKGGP